MTSTIKISDIIHCVVKSPSDIAESRYKEGRLPAGSVLNRIQPGETIDVIVLKKSPALLCDTSIEINETDVRKRIAYKYSDISDNCFNNQRLPVGTKFFKDMQPTDTIYLILHP
jgi:hypothetical protein